MKDKFSLGINFLHSDTAACLFKNGELLAAAEEERFTRVKHTMDFPYNAINFCLDSEGLNISNIDFISINSNPFSSLLKKIFFMLKNPSSIGIALNSLSNSKKKFNLKNFISRIDNKKKFNGIIKYIDHHESHIASSLYFSEFESCVNLSVDGFGDFASCAWGPYDQGKLKIDKKIYFPHSLGIFYQAMTQYLGFKNYGDEYKVMGLSSYGDPTYVEKIKKLIIKEEEGFKLNLKFFNHHKSKILDQNKYNQAVYSDLYSEKLISLLGKPRSEREQINKEHMDLAKSIQFVYEDTFFHLLKILNKKYKYKNLSLSGGCAMNSVANGKIFANSQFKNIYISPNPGDAGGSIGSACININRELKKNIKVKNYAYLGSQFDNKTIEKTLKDSSIIKSYKIKYVSDAELYNEIARKISESKVIGWFQNKTEWGPRALGNRSILADARNKDIKDIINLKIKRRESFRPFAPSILYEQLSEWFELSKEVPFMSEVYSIKKNKKIEIPGVTHIDGSGRLQTVREKNNYKYYNLIKKFYELTGVPVILNTSFNENEPIVNTPMEAIDCFHRTNMDILVLENYIISR